MATEFELFLALIPGAAGFGVFLVLNPGAAGFGVFLVLNPGAARPDLFNANAAGVPVVVSDVAVDGDAAALERLLVTWD